MPSAQSRKMIVYDLIICFVTAVAVAAAEIGLNLHNSFVWDFYVIIKALNNKLKPSQSNTKVDGLRGEKWKHFRESSPFLTLTRSEIFRDSSLVARIFRTAQKKK